MKNIEEFESQKKEIDESKLLLKNKYENLIKLKENEISEMKQYEDMYFSIKD